MGVRLVTGRNVDAGAGAETKSGQLDRVGIYARRDGLGHHHLHYRRRGRRLVLEVHHVGQGRLPGHPLGAGAGIPGRPGDPVGIAVVTVGDQNNRTGGQRGRRRVGASIAVNIVFIRPFLELIQQGLEIGQVAVVLVTIGDDLVTLPRHQLHGCLGLFVGLMDLQSGPESEGEGLAEGASSGFSCTQRCDTPFGIGRRVCESAGGYCPFD